MLSLEKTNVTLLDFGFERQQDSNRIKATTAAKPTTAATPPTRRKHNLHCDQRGHPTEEDEEKKRGKNVYW